MTWRDRLRPGSFRSVRFYMDTAEADLGRRVAVHEFRDREDVVTEDDGKSPRRFGMQVYVIGPNYDLARDALEAALLTGGVGTMVHPYRGPLQVTILPGIKVKETKDEGGIARFTFNVVEQAPPTSNSTTPTTAPQVQALSTAVSAQTSTAFTKTFSTTGMPTNYVASAVSRVQQTAAVLAQVQSGMGAAISGVDAVSARIASFAANAESLVASPLVLASTYQGLVADVLGAGAAIVATSKLAVRSAIQLYQSLALIRATVMGGKRMHAIGVGDPASSPVTALSRREAGNLAALNVLVRVSATAMLARAATGLPFTSYQEALAYRALVSGNVDDLLGVVDDDTFGSMTSMRAVTASHLAQAASTLPELRSFEVPAEVSTLLVAHWLYGDARREDEIIVRNAPNHPGLLAVGSILEVAS